MSNSAKAGVPVIGVIFLLLAVFKLVSGDAWVVWAILGVFFGGLGILNLTRSGGSNT